MLFFYIHIFNVLGFVISTLGIGETHQGIGSLGGLFQGVFGFWLSARHWEKANEWSRQGRIVSPFESKQPSSELNFSTKGLSFIFDYFLLFYYLSFGLIDWLVGNWVPWCRKNDHIKGWVCFCSDLRFICKFSCIRFLCNHIYSCCLLFLYKTCKRFYAAKIFCCYSSFWYCTLYCIPLFVHVCIRL